METIKTENKVESKTLNQDEIKKIYIESDKVNQRLTSSLLNLSSFLEHLNENRDVEILWNLLWDVVEELRLSISSSVKYYDLSNVDLSNAEITYN